MQTKKKKPFHVVFAFRMLRVLRSFSINFSPFFPWLLKCFSPPKIVEYYFLFFFFMASLEVQGNGKSGIIGFSIYFLLPLFIP